MSVDRFPDLQSSIDNRNFLDRRGVPKPPKVGKTRAQDP